ncbi:Undecaprenyl phosphate N,N'-diacetylbacillosamine 1-phosphate transferase [Roseovarius litorisediminis]|uniref:Undecaprenyl phosphate N,N'-diacetylbacillosamine 1-phosphate transferase n=1 Tax=Roseovarius litorisediminis TaxID=1312363 RepID=A0A1Y5SRR9_9RHOB|nr:sugar transferase [Roseovarius litorisediminis]SLN46943.1 Undecaprenyl phosphate N,N'-diacetylbacillosamine 1-phosphate transferase [Roseovarius litorisediminis]
MTIQRENFTNSDSSPVETFRANISGTARGGIYCNLFKRLLDLFFVLMAAPFVVPVVLLLALFISRDGHNPFYRQVRVGRAGRNFTMWKLRTMVPDAENKLEDFLADDASARNEWNEKQKLADDPRVTRLGALIRKCSIDELPQLWNVLVGDMSLVGPRPMMPEQRRLYPGLSYFTLRPGVSGPWQVSDRNSSSFAARAEFDDQYNNNVSLKNDVRIILCTFLVVVRGTGC